MFLVAVMVAGCRSTSPAAADGRDTDRYGLLVHCGEGVAIEPFFQSHRCMVTAVRDVTKGSDGWTVQTVYPSSNWSPGGGIRDSIQYPQEVTVANPHNVPVDPMQIDRATTMLVLVLTEPGGSAYELLGTAPLREGGDMSWFKDRRELLFRPR